MEKIGRKTVIAIYTIMIVEDDKTIRLEIQVLLKNAGYEVYAVENFEDVIYQIKKVQPHLIVMDVMLPIRSGLEICMELRSFSQIPLLFVTNCNTTEDEIRCITMGGDDRQRDKLIWKQLLLYFGCPLLLPVLISMVVSLKLNQVLLTGTQIQTGNYLFFGVALALFLLVYSIYFTVTYLCFKRNVEVEG